MQTIERQTPLAHKFLEDIDRLYAQTSSSQNILLPEIYDEGFKDIVGIFVVYSDMTLKVEYSDVVPVLKAKKYPSKNIIVCFSGGRDSFVTARHYQKLGYNVMLYYVEGLNGVYSAGGSELEVVRKASDYLGLPLTVESIKYHGHHTWFEHPLKNMLLWSMALSWGILHDYSIKVATGNFSTARLDDNPFPVCAGDCIEVLNSFETIVRRFLPKFRMYHPSRNLQTTMNYFLKQPDELRYVVSCMTPIRFRNQFRERTIGNYSIDLLPNRCGCCWKDCTEYIWAVDHNIRPLDRPYYLHCINVLANTMKRERGRRPFFVFDVWNEYMLYPFKKSKLFEELNYARIPVIER